MKPQFQPWHLLLLILGGWINSRQQDAIEYLLTENRVLREKLGKKRILLNDDQRRLLAVKGKILGRKMLEHLAGIVTPETILRWHRELVARHWDYSGRRKAAGRPAVTPEIVELVLRIAKESPTWGYDRIQGALANLGHHISDTTVANVLGAHGIEPSPDRRVAVDLEDLSRSPLGSSGVGGLHDDRGLDEERVGHLLPVVLHGTGHAACALCGSYGESG